MSDYMKLMKNCLRSEEYNNYQNQAKLYSKSYNTILEGRADGNSCKTGSSSAGNNITTSLINSADQNNQFQIKEIFSNSNQFNGELIKEKVLKWFFSLPLESRIKIATVENSFIANMIHQMHFRYKGDVKIVFQSKPDNSEENQNSSGKDKYLFKMASDSNSYTEEENLQSNILNFFNFKSNRTESPDSMVENIWLQDVRFYSLHSELDAITVVPRVLKEEGMFLYYFRYAGSPKAFFNLIRPQFDAKNKLHSYHLPDWFDPKEYFTVGQYVAAYIEQAILIKFILNYTRKDRVIYSLINDKKMSEYFQKRKDVLACLSKHFNYENKSKLFNYILPKRIFNEIAYDKNIDKIKKLKDRHFDVGYQYFVSKRFTQGKSPCFFASTDVETEEKIIAKYKNEHYIHFVDNALYHDFESIWKDNYFISIKLFDHLHCLYTDKNYEELINDMVESQESKRSTNKKGKKNNVANSRSSTNSKKKSVSVAITTPSYSPLEDPDFEFYSAYLLDQKSQNNITKEKKSVTKASFDSSPAPKQEPIAVANKTYLYDSYRNGQKNLINDFVKNYILKDIIESAYEKGKNSVIIKTTSCAELLNDICKISTKSKMINYYLTNNVELSKKVDDIEPNTEYNKDKVITDTKFDSLPNLNNYNTENGKLEIRSETVIDTKDLDVVNYQCMDFKEIKENSDEKINSILETENTISFSSECENKCEFKSYPQVDAPSSTIPKSNPKKKKKEPSFFLYDTSKKKKDKNNNNANSININKNTNNSTNTSNNTTSSTNNITTPGKELESEKAKEVITDTMYQTTSKVEKTKTSPNSQNSKFDNHGNYQEGYFAKSSRYQNRDYNSSSSQNNKNMMRRNIGKELNYRENSKDNSYYGGESGYILAKDRSNSYYTKEYPDYKYQLNYDNNGNFNNYNNSRGYYNKREREVSTIEASSNQVGNNYYIFNSITQVSPINPVMMYMNPSPYVASASNSNMRNLVSNINLNKYSNDFLTFVYKLHNDIVSYNRTVTDTLDSMKEIKVYVIQYIEKLIKENISDDFSIDIYGSFASDLSIESSDIDIKIRMKSLEEENFATQFDLEGTIMLLVKNFTSLNLFESVMPIYTASVPIIKIVVDPAKVADDDNLMRLEEFKNSDCNLNYKFDKEEITKIKIDLTFLDMAFKNSFSFGQGNNLMSSVEFAKNKLILYPEIKPLLQLVKRFVQIRKMNSCFNGGLSSFCLFLLILAFIKFKYMSQPQVNQNNLGRLLLDFFEFYGRMFNFHGCTIDVNLPNPFVINNEIFEKSPVILDPLSYLNASKSSYRIDEVKESFADALDYLNMIKLKYDKIDITPSTTNIVYDLLLNYKK